MRAVNLIPTDQRRGAGGVAGRAGGAAYVLVGALVVIVAMAIVYAVASKQASDRKSKIATVTAQADTVQAQAAALQPYVQFASLSQQRKQAVVNLANARFNWSGAMDQIARALPADVTLNSLTGTAPGSTATTGAATAGSATAAAAAAAGAGGGPSFDFTGCASSHSEVATVLVDLRRIEGVTGVSLSTSSKPTSTGGATGASTPSSGSAATGGCPHVSFHGTLSYSSGYTVGGSPALIGNAPLPASASAGAAATQPAVGSAPAASSATPAAATRVPAPASTSPTATTAASR